MPEGVEVPAGEIVLETSVDFKGLNRDLDELRKRGEEAGEGVGEAVGGGARDGAEEAGPALGKLKENLDRVAGDAEDASEASHKTEASLSDLAATSENAGELAAGLAIALGEKLARGGAKFATKAVGALEIAVEKVAAGVAGFGQQIQASADDMEHFDGTARAVGKTMESVGHSIEGVAKALTALRVALVTGAILTLARGVQQAEKFEESFAQMQTVLPQTGAELTRIRARLSELAAETGQTAETVNQTFFKTITRLPRLANDVDKAMAVTRTALEAGATGFTTAGQAVETFEALLQGFQEEASNAEEISSKLFRTQELAGVSFQKIAASVGDLAAITDALGGEMDDLLAIYATMVPTGQSVSEVTTQVGSVIQGLINPTSEARREAKALGIDLSAAAVRSKGLVNVMREIVEVTDGDPEAISKLFGRQEAIQFLTAIASRMETVELRINQIGDAAGTHQKTVDEMSDRISHQKDLIAEEWNDAFRQLGFTINAVFGRPFLDALKVLRFMSELFTEITEKALKLARVFEFGRIGDFGRRLIGEPELETTEERTRRLFEDIRRTADETGQSLRDVFDVAVDELELAEDMVSRLNELVEEAQATFDRRVHARPGRTSLAFLDLGFGGEQGPEGSEEELVSPIDAAIERINELRQAGQALAFAEFLRTDDVGAYEAALRDVQRRVNRLVEEEFTRLTEVLGFQRSELEGLISMYERGLGPLDNWRERLAEVRVEGTSLGDTLTEDVGGALDGLLAQVRQLASEKGFTLGPGGQLVPADEDVRRLASLAREMERINRVAQTEEQRLRLAQKALDEHGLSVEDVKNSTSDLADIILRELLRALPEWAEEMLGVTDETDDASDSTRDLVDEVENLVQLAGGVLALADAFGVFGDEAERELNRAVRSATQLVQGIQSLQSAIAQGASGLSLLGPIGAIAGGAAGLISGVAGLIGGGGPSEETLRIRREADELANALRRLRESAEAARSVFEEVPGADIEKFIELLSGGLESRDPFGATFDPESFEAEMDRLGLTLSDLQNLADAAGVDINDLVAALQGETAWTRAVRDEVDALREGLKSLSLERALSTFAGQMSLLEQEFELLDIEDPVDQLRRFREELLGFEGLPSSLRGALQGADLSTAEGRRQFEQAIEAIFRQLQAGELTAADLGGLTLSEFRDLLGQLEGTLDEAAREEAGRTGGFQQTRGITEVTAGRLTGRLSSLDVRAAKRNELLASILTTLGGTVPATARPSSPVAAAPRPAGGVQIASLSVGPIGPIDVSLEGISGDPRAAGEAFGAGFGDEAARRIDRTLARLRDQRGR